MDMHRCGSQTQTGGDCKRIVKEGEHCFIHTGTQCSVCLSIVSRLPNRTLPCGHIFHMRCIDRWKISCKTPIPTCPMCRAEFDKPLFRCKLIIDDVTDGTTETRVFYREDMNPILAEGFGLDTSILETGHVELTFNIQQGESLEELLGQLGI